MASDSSFLFSGIRFDRKKFGADIARFQVPSLSHRAYAYSLLHHILLITVIFRWFWKEKGERYWFGEDLERCRRRKRENEGSSRRENNVHEEEEAQGKLFRYSHSRALFILCYLLYSTFHISLLFCVRKRIKETVEGFNVFRNSASGVQSSGEVQADEESIELNKMNKKEKNRQLEVPFLFCDA